MKEQHILFFSDHQRPAAELPVPLDDRYRLTYCASDNRSADGTGILQQRFDWILIDGAEIGGDQTEFFQSLRAIGLLLSERRPGYCAGLQCRVEWDKNGILQLRCSRQHASAAERRPQNADAAADAASFIFEYQAPMERTG